MNKYEQKTESMNITVKTKVRNNGKSGDLLLSRRRQSLRRAWAFGISYLFAIGIPSLISANNSDLITTWNGVAVKNPHRLYTHDVFWTETRANRRAAKYFGKYYGINWDDFPKYPLSNPFI